jgi:hypothetical protein
MPYQTVTTTTAAAGAATSTSTSGCGCGCSSCTSCDSLQCLCRPRFFAGQLLTDTDFRRLEQYLVGKDRLHNKFLHGTGVVCGLEVVCNPCDDTVTVRPGYALGPCGEDIVVCADASVPVGRLIRDQRTATARTNCADPYANPPAGCDELQQRWTLGICYDEQPAKPVTTLTTPASCPSSCGCGGSTSGSSSSGGCGCGGSSRSVSTLPAGCEPTVTCEGYRFVLTKEQPVLTASDGKTASTSALVNRVQQCLSTLTANITKAPAKPTPAQLVTYCCQLKADLQRIIASGNIHDCTLGQRLSAIVCPSSTDKTDVALAEQSIAALLTLAVDIMRECICSALLPPCPDACAQDCVPIATLTVRSSDLTVLDVCNWSSREFAVTMPMLGYWLGVIPLGAALRKAVSTLCCPPSTRPRFRLDENLAVSPAVQMSEFEAATAQPRLATHTTPPTTAAAPASSLDALIPEQLRIAARYVTEPSTLSGLDATLLTGLGMTGPQDQPLASASELDAPLTALALSRVLGPEGFDLGEPIRTISATVGPRLLAQSAADERLARLEKTVSSLQSTVKTQQGTIADLQGQLDKSTQSAKATAPRATKAPAAKKAAKATKATKATKAAKATPRSRR